MQVTASAITVSVAGEKWGPRCSNDLAGTSTGSMPVVVAEIRRASVGTSSRLDAHRRRPRLAEPAVEAIGHLEVLGLELVDGPLP